MAASLTAVTRVTALAETELDDLCEATEAAILDGGGFGWLEPPPRQVLEAFWNGVLLVPERELFLAQLDDRVVGSAQLVGPARNNEAQAFAATLVAMFLSPWARGHGLARNLVEAVIEHARAAGYSVLNLDVRESQTAAIGIYESMGFVRWGTHPRYALVDGKIVPGNFYFLALD